MKAKEALQEILDSTPKDKIWYKVTSDYDEVNRLRNTALRILQDESKMQISTLDWFFSKFGYEIKITINKTE